MILCKESTEIGKDLPINFEMENAIKLNNEHLSYQKVVHKILAKTNSNNVGQAIYKAVKLSLI
ncbi:hypothetical protein [Faecalibacillus intestinalis]|uniref:hypothetical protein n=1 Tax=Faecalibacillus intestinalis TaxID=1982626 RepID=UPI0039930D9A